MKIEPVSIVDISRDLTERLTAAMAVKRLGPVPSKLIDRRPDRIFIGEATREIKAMAILYDELNRQHEQMHKETGLPYGVNPYVPPDHFHLHVQIPLLHEMMDWSAHRAFPKQESGLGVRFDRDWNMFGQFPKRLRKKALEKKKGS